MGGAFEFWACFIFVRPQGCVSDDNLWIVLIQSENCYATSIYLYNCTYYMILHTFVYLYLIYYIYITQYIQYCNIVLELYISLFKIYYFLLLKKKSDKFFFKFCIYMVACILDIPNNYVIYIMLFIECMYVYCIQVYETIYVFDVYI